MKTSSFNPKSSTTWPLTPAPVAELAGSFRLASFGALGLMLGAGGACGQDALRHSIAGEAAYASRRVRLEGVPYTYKTGDFRLLVTPSVSLDWNDNVHLSDERKRDDFILRPDLNLSASYPLTQRNLLTLDIGVGYRHYFSESELSRWYVRSGSLVSFDIFVGDFLFNLHDRFSYTQDAALQPEIANTGDRGEFQNIAGLSATWDLRDLTLNGSYDHMNVISTESTFEQRDRSTEMLVARAGFKLHPELLAGLETSAAFTTYDKKLLNDNQAYSVGIYGDYHPSRYFSVTPRAGYSYYAFDQTSTVMPAEDMDSWYADLTLRHAPTEVLTYTLSIGRELRMGVETDAIESTYFRPSANWGIFKHVSVNTGLSYEHGEESGGSLRGGTTEGETYDHLSANVGLGYSPWKRVNVGLSYRFTLRESDEESREYTQNMVSLTLTYRP